MSEPGEHCHRCKATLASGAVLCSRCADVIAATLRELDDLVSQVTMTLSRQDVRGVQLAVSVRTDERPMPYDGRASSWLTSMRAWAGLWSLRLGYADPGAAVRAPGRFAAYLAGVWQYRALTRRIDVAEFCRVVEGLADRGRAIIDLPPEKWFIGVCSTVVTADDGELVCERDLYARTSAATVECPQCGTVHDVEQRRAALLLAVEDTLATAPDISRAVHLLERPLTVSSIHNHAHRGRLVRRGKNPAGEHLYRVGDVMDLAASIAARKASRAAGNWAKKPRARHAS